MGETDAKKSDDRIPVTVLTGFLGSGKTVGSLAFCYVIVIH